ncbi:MAG: NAD-dependent succinate-semialdehyde dehydrogenase [Chloroflexi bacterium]|nr:MAG: NAD-dependent succinate-semialdehyde dehydrogenase [Chloroflexota bacterium]
MAIATINPATGETVRTFEAYTPEQVINKLDISWQIYNIYRKVPLDQRTSWMENAAQILENRKEEFGRLMTLEMGKPLKAAIAEAEKCAWVFRYYAENAPRYLEDREVKTDAAHSFVRFQPVGPVLAVMPWNFPFWQVIRFAAPNLVVGNACLLKHASNVPQCALAIEELIREAGFPEGLFQTLLIGSDRVEEVLKSSRVRAATLTGSTAAGSAVASTAGKMIKKTVLELGGSDPFIVMPSADMEQAITTAVRARTINNGQSCIAAKRFIVHEAIADEFERRFVEGMRSLRIGDPLDPATQLGPLATMEQRDLLAGQVRQSVDLGARVLTGGHALDRPGAYYAPTVLTDIRPDSPAYRDELFGPVALLFRVPDAEAAIRLANDTRFGLGASVWTNDEAERRQAVAGIEAGMVFINAMTASDPRIPFGGVKRSGYGRELSELGIREFVNVKTLWVGPAKAPRASSPTERSE